MTGLLVCLTGAVGCAHCWWHVVQRQFHVCREPLQADLPMCGWLRALAGAGGAGEVRGAERGGVTVKLCRRQGGGVVKGESHLHVFCDQLLPSARKFRVMLLLPLLLLLLMLLMLLLLLLQVSKTYPVSVTKPDWLAAALKSPNKTAVALPGIVRSPQIDGYRCVWDLIVCAFLFVSCGLCRFLLRRFGGG